MFPAVTTDFYQIFLYIKQIIRPSNCNLTKKKTKQESSMILSIVSVPCNKSIDSIDTKFSRYLPSLICREYSLMITRPAYCWQDEPSYRSYHLQNSILIYWYYRKDPYCILLLSVMSVDATQKKMMKFGLLGAEIWEFYSRRDFRQDITLVELSLMYSVCTIKYENIDRSWNTLYVIYRVYRWSHT